jgi:hypothetical protein
MHGKDMPLSLVEGLVQQLVKLTFRGRAGQFIVGTVDRIIWDCRQHIVISLHLRGGQAACSVETFVAYDYIQPSGESRTAPKCCQMPVRLEKYILGEIGRSFAFAGEAEAPSANFVVVAAE